MSQLAPLYDSILFFEDHKDKFYPYIGNYEELKTAERIILWPWPGSGSTNVRVRTAEAEEIENINISHVYKDKDGREWGLIARGIENGFNSDMWVCISDPGNDAIPEFNPPHPRRREFMPPPHTYSYRVIILL